MEKRQETDLCADRQPFYCTLVLTVKYPVIKWNEVKLQKYGKFKNMLKILNTLQYIVLKFHLFKSPIINMFRLDL